MSVQKVYAFKNNLIENSSSGAAFPSIIEAISRIKMAYLDNTMIVYGAAFDNEFGVCHQRAEDQVGYLKFRGSKYVKSDMGDSYKLIQKDLENGHKVLFTGTPCQVYALSNFLEKKQVNRKNLYLVDIICHGTPRKSVWKDFVAWIEKKNNATLTEFSFRYQKARWKNYPVMAKFSNNRQVVNSFVLRQYTNLFFTHLIMQEGCYHCKFCNTDRPGDLTIGDFWGIKEVLPEYPFDNSVSEILVNTEKGKDICRILKSMAESNNDIVMMQCNSNEYIKYQHNLNQPTEKPACYEEFWNDYDTNGLEYVMKKYSSYNWKGRIKHCIKKTLSYL